MKAKVLKQMQQENREYREYLVSGALTVEQIVDGAYEITMKQFILDAMETLAQEDRLQDAVWSWLEQQENVLDYLYSLWMNCDISFIPELADVMLDELNYDKEVQV